MENIWLQSNFSISIICKYAKNPAQVSIFIQNNLHVYAKAGAKKVPRNSNGITTGIVCKSSSHGSLWAFRKRAISSSFLIIYSYRFRPFVRAEHPPTNLPDLCILCGSIVHHLFPIRDLGNLKFFNPLRPGRPGDLFLSKCATNLLAVSSLSEGDVFTFDFSATTSAPRRCGASKTASSLSA